MFNKPILKMTDQLISRSMTVAYLCGSYAGRFGSPDDRGAGLSMADAALRKYETGISVGDIYIYPALPCRRLPEKVKDLYDWMANSELDALFRGCIYLYESAVLVPYEGDSLKQAVALFKAWLPGKYAAIRQLELYEAMMADPEQLAGVLKKSVSGDATLFIEYVLGCMAQTMAADDRFAQAACAEGMKSHSGREADSTREKVLRLLMDDPKLTAKGIAASLGVSDRQIERVLAGLKKDGRIVRVGASKNGTWIVNP